MDRGTVARIEDWESSPLSGGHAGLWNLAEQDFSGAVNARGAWLFMLNGRVVGVFGGSMATFEDADGTAYRAPHPSLPLLFAMQERGGETQAKYYTDDTPLSEVDRTLSESNFTGYVELSENVLSGDYYVVYYGGRSMSAAFIGNAEQLLTGEEAFERANDEVGIYEVREVDLDVEEVPEPDDAAGAGPGSAVGTDSEGATDAEPAREAAEPSPDEPAVDTGEETPAPEPERDAEPEPESAPEVEHEPPATGEESQPAADSPEAAASGDRVEEATPSPDEPAGAEPTEDAGASTPERSGRQSDATAEPTDVDESEEPAEAARSDPGDEAPREAGDQPGDAGGEAEDPFTEEEEWRETRTIPALDPDESGTGDGPAEASGADRATGGESNARSTGRQSEPAGGPEQASRDEPAGAEPASGRAGASTGEDTARAGERARELRSELEEREAALEQRRAELEDLQSRLEEANEEREALREERDRLRERVDQLEAQVERLDGGVPEGGTALTPDDALTKTDLFVRYGSKGEATLEDAHGGEAHRDDVIGNLRLEQHTRFEADDASVAGEPFEAYLTSTVEYRFVEWVIENLLFEVQDTGNQKTLSALYDALPALDRVEFRGTVTSRDDEGEERRETFDVVMRDRMGQPLFVADINDARDPATGEMMGDLVERSKVVADGHESLGGAFLVTSSFFEPDALETAAEATGGGFLDRGSKKSFVKLSRKRGYHLCLVEARGDDFHVAVPEL